MSADEGTNVVARNRRARHEFEIMDKYEAGMVLKGTEVKSVRAGQVAFRDAFARVEAGEVFLHDLHISPYEQGNRWNVDPDRVRKLLLNRREIIRSCPIWPKQPLKPGVRNKRLHAGLSVH